MAVLKIRSGGAWIEVPVGVDDHDDLANVTEDQHHVRSHDHSAAGDGQDIAPLSLNLVPTTLTLSTGIVAATRSAHIIAAETGTTDTLASITGGADGDLLYLVADAGDLILVTHNDTSEGTSGNRIFLPDSSAYFLADIRFGGIGLRYAASLDSGNGGWRVAQDTFPHKLLDTVRHSDTTTHIVVRGELIIGGASAWTPLAIGTAETILGSDGSDPRWAVHQHSITITVENPTAGEDIDIHFFNAPVTVQEIDAVVVGSSTPSVTIELKHSSDRSAGGNDILSSPTAITNTTTGQNLTSFDDPTIPADSHLWLETTAKSGIVNKVRVTARYTYD